MREGDLERIIEIDNLVLGERRPDWRDWTLLQLSDAMGFKRPDMINLEFKIED